MMNKNSTFLALIMGLVAIPISLLSADVVIVVDVTDPSAVTFTPTVSLPEVTVGPYNSNDFGVTLVDFFDGNATKINGGGFDVSGELNVLDSTSGMSRSPLVGMFVANYADWTMQDVNFYNFGLLFDVYFDVSQPAFTGQYTANFTNLGFTGVPVAGTTGNVITSSPGSPQVIGQWQVVALILGDVNGDGAVNLLDVDPFIDRVSNGSFQAEADINQDGVVNLLDVGPFVNLLNGN